MKLTVELLGSKADFILELLQNLPLVKIQQERKAKKAILVIEMQEIVTELNEVLAGRKESRDVYDFLKELKSEDE